MPYNVPSTTRIEGVTLIGDTQRAREVYAATLHQAATSPVFCQRIYNHAWNEIIQWTKLDRRDSPEFYDKHMRVWLADDPEALAIWQAIDTPAALDMMDANPRASHAMLTALLETLKTTQPSLLIHLSNIRRIQSATRGL